MFNMDLDWNDFDTANETDISSLLLQRYQTATLQMAFGKKSFLIRDILSNRVTNEPRLDFDSQKIIEWLVGHSKSSVQSQHNQRIIRDKLKNSNENPLELLSNLETNENLQRLQSQPWIQSWFEMNELQNNIQLDFIPNLLNNQSKQLEQIQSNQFYHDFYYYALQQQINAALINCNSAQKHCPNSTEDKQRKSTLQPNKPKENPKTKPVKGFQVDKKCKSRPSRKSAKTKKSKPVDESQDKIGLDLRTSKPTMSKLGNIFDSEVVENDLWSDCECNEQLDPAGDAECAAKTRCRKLRRNRTVFTELQLMGLERRFDSQKYLSTPDRADLARALGLTQLQVKTWYQNRRMKWKKQVMQNGCPFPPTKPKGRPKKDSIPTYGLEFTNSILCPIFATHSQPNSTPVSSTSPLDTGANTSNVN